MAKINPIFGALDNKAEDRAIAEAEADIAAGRFVAHGDVIRWVKSWFTPDELPMPESKTK